MKQLIAATLGFGIIVLGIPAVGQPAECPPELTQARDIQSPRSQQEIPVPRGQEIQAPRVNQAAGLVQQSEAACKKGDMALSTRKAKEALGLLKK